MEPLAQDYFGESRSQLIKSLESQRRSNRLMLSAATFTLICGTGLCVCLFFLIPPSGGSLMEWSKSLLARVLPIAVILGGSVAQFRMFLCGQRDLAAHQRELREVEMLRAATVSALAARNHDVLANAWDHFIELDGPTAYASAKHAATMEPNTVVHLSKYVPSDEGGNLAGSPSLKESLERWRTRVLQSNLQKGGEGDTKSRHSKRE